MPMDGFTLSFLTRELRGVLLGGRVDKVNQPERDALVLLIRSGGNHRLLLSANANQARVQLTAQTYENPAEPPMFCMLMRKHLLGSRIVELRQVAGDRILAISFDCLDELGDHVQKTLYLEIMGRHSNVIHDSRMDPRAAQEAQYTHCERIVNVRQIEECREIIKYLLRGESVLLNLENIDPKDCGRVVDLLSGAAFALQGRMLKVAHLSYLLAPENVEVIEEDVYAASRMRYR